MLNSDNTISIILYHKPPTDTHNYLLYSSSHPKHCKDGMPYGQFLRVRRICSSTDDFETKAIEMGKHFIRRGYPKWLVSDSFIRALRKPREELLQVKPSTSETNSKTFYRITTFHPSFNGFKETITKNWDFLTRSNITKDLRQHKVIFGNRRNKNLRDILVKAKLTPPNTKNTTDQPMVAHSNPCKTPTCRYCPKIDTSGRITSTYTGRSYQSRIRVDCKSNNLIYCITCKICKLQYVRMTKNRLMDRFQAHFYNITSNKTEHAIGRHFNLPSHNGINDVTIHILDFIHMNAAKPDSEHLRRYTENNWQHRLHTIAPLGLNIQD